MKTARANTMEQSTLYRQSQRFCQATSHTSSSSCTQEQCLLTMAAELNRLGMKFQGQGNYQSALNAYNDAFATIVSATAATSCAPRKEASSMEPDENYGGSRPLTFCRGGADVLREHIICAQRKVSRAMTQLTSISDGRLLNGEIVVRHEQHQPQQSLLETSAKKIFKDIKEESRWSGTYHDCAGTNLLNETIPLVQPLDVHVPEEQANRWGRLIFGGIAHCCPSAQNTTSGSKRGLLRTLRASILCNMGTAQFLLGRCQQRLQKDPEQEHDQEESIQELSIIDDSSITIRSDQDASSQYYQMAIDSFPLSRSSSSSIVNGNGCGSDPIASRSINDISETPKRQQSNDGNAPPAALIVALNNTAHVHCSNGKVEDAVKVLTHAVECVASIICPSAVLSSQDNGESLRQRQLVLEVASTVLINHAVVLSAIASACEARGMISEVLRVYTQILRTRSEVFGLPLNCACGTDSEHLSTSTRVVIGLPLLAQQQLNEVYACILYRMGCFLYRTNHPSRALKALQLSLSLRPHIAAKSQRPPRKNIDGAVDAAAAAVVASLCYDIGTIQLELNQPLLALRSLRRCLKIRRAIHERESSSSGENDRAESSRIAAAANVAEVLYRIGRIQQDMHHHSEALAIYHETLRYEQIVYGMDHPEVSITMTNIAQIYHTTGQYDNALHLYITILRLIRKSLGEDHPGVAEIQHTIGTIYLNRGDYDRAVVAFADARSRMASTSVDGSASRFFGRDSSYHGLYQIARPFSRHMDGNRTQQWEDDEQHYHDVTIRAVCDTDLLDCHLPGAPAA